MRARMMSVLAAASIGGATLFLGGVAQASESPIGGSGAHTHHVHTGNGECVDIDQVAFRGEARGLHQGATRGAPYHRSCASHHPH